MMPLGHLLDRLRRYELRGDPRTTVAGVEHDSRRVVRGSVFVAIPGARFDGHQFAPRAAEQGASALVVERWLTQVPEQLPQVRVDRARQALPLLAAGYYRDPSERLTLVGVTGTNGKTTVTYLLEAIFQAAGNRCGVLGTVSYRYAGRRIAAERTTPEATDLQRHLAQMVGEGCDTAVMEVASHALAMNRVAGCRFAAAVFTNLTRDHLDFHHDLEDYFAAKRRLFEMLPPGAPAILNADDPRCDALAAATRGRVVRYGSSPGCAVRIAQVEALRGGLHLTLETPAGILELQSPLLGRVNAFNIAAAAATALALDVAPSAVSAGVAAMAQVPGRCQPVECGQPFLVVVDYAHSDDSLRNLLIGLRELTVKRLLVVFGCGGDRDRGKRPRMGAVAAELADLVFLTSDNPRSEDPRAILEEVLAGIPAARRTQCTVEPDRRSAIAQALAEASPGDVVAIAGKGHETVQLAGDRVIDFDDRVVADELLEELGWRA